MARSAYKTTINSETTRDHLELCLIEAEHSSDANVQKAAAEAKTELWRRDQQEWADRFAAQESARVKSQKFQDGQMAKQLDVAEKQSNSAKHAAWAAWASALAAFVLVIISAIQVFGEPR